MIDGKTKKYCLIGESISYSLSPIIMNMLFEKYNINSVYFSCDIEKDVFEDAVKGLRALGVSGYNITIPYKERIINYIDELSESAEIIGAVNTILYRDELLYGYNTDWIGVSRALSEFGYDRFNRCIVLGAGGAAKAAVYAVIPLCNEIIIINRTLDKAVNAAEVFQRVSKNISAEKYDLKTIYKILLSCDLIINATPIGVNREESLIPFDAIPRSAVVFDFVYSPLETLLLRYAKRKGAISIDGLWMLIYQASEAFKIWTGINPQPKEIRYFLEKVV